MYVYIYYGREKGSPLLISFHLKLNLFKRGEDFSCQRLFEYDFNSSIMIRLNTINKEFVLYLKTKFNENIFVFKKKLVTYVLHD